MSRRQPNGRRTFTDAERAEIMELANEVGPAEAARRAGVNPRTIRTWRRRAQQAGATAVATVEAEVAEHPEAVDVELVEPSVRQILVDRGKPWAERAEAMATAMADGAAEAVALSRSALAAGDAKRAKEAAITSGILIDKALLITGHPTRRTETHSTSTVEQHVTVVADDRLRAQVTEVRAELGIIDAEVVDDDA